MNVGSEAVEDPGIDPVGGDSGSGDSRSNDGAVAPVASDVALDRVMLAMDVVDTLRHERKLVAVELDDERRQAELVARIRGIYDSQGIEVSDEVIAEGVAALREERFVYRPPERSFEVWLAEVYVDRRKWAIVFGSVALVALLVWGAIAVPAWVGEQNRIAAFEQASIDLGARAREAANRGGALRGQLDHARGLTSAVQPERLFDEAESALLRGLGFAETLRDAVVRLPQRAGYVEAAERWDTAVAAATELAGNAETAFDETRATLDAIVELRRLHDGLAALRQRIDEAELDAVARRDLVELAGAVDAAITVADPRDAAARLHELEAALQERITARQVLAELRQRFEIAVKSCEGADPEPVAQARAADLESRFQQGILSGDAKVVAETVRDLEALAEQLLQSYELRIVTRRNQRSGVWRHPNRNRNARNYYIIVEAVDADGKRLRLPIENEETGRTSRVRTFGVRVSEAAYEQVKADKLDNGLIDRSRFGRKRRGRLAPDYDFDVVGGFITRW
ncbi:MAG: DUF6384 family protein [bacterium]|nr:DUF6384 family protein [bacterium]